MAYSTGDLREHITIERQVTERNANGYTETAWEDMFGETVAASVSDVSGRDYFAALAAGALDTVTFTTRYLEGVDTKCRVVWQEETYEITEVNRLGAKRDYMTIKTRRRS